MQITSPSHASTRLLRILRRRQVTASQRPVLRQLIRPQFLQFLRTALAPIRHLWRRVAPPTSLWATIRVTARTLQLRRADDKHRLHDLSKDSFRGRYIYNRLVDGHRATVPFPIFFTPQPFRYQLVALSEYHTFTPNLTNEFRIGYNRYAKRCRAGNFTFPAWTVPNLIFDDQGFINVGPDRNAPQFTIQNLYQLTDNVSYVKGKHTFTIGFDGRKYISPQGFTQRARGDYEWDNLTEFLHDLAPPTLRQSAPPAT